MTGESTIGLGRAPRAVADAPIEGLLARADELAKRWALALADAHALSEIAAIPFAQIAGLGPSLCARVLRAVSSDDALASAGSHEGGEGGGALRLEWDGDAPAAVAAVEALRAVLWEALVNAASAETLVASSDRMLRDLADRLAYVCSVVLARSLDVAVSPAAFDPAGRPVPAPPPAPTTSPFLREPTVHRAGAGSPPRDRAGVHPRPGRREPSTVHAFSGARGEPGAPREAPPAAPSARSRAVLVDEFVQGTAGVAETAGALRTSRDAASAAQPRRVFEGDRLRRDAGARALPWDIPLAGDRGGEQRRAPGDSRAWRADPAPGSEAAEISVLRRRPPRERE